MDKTLSAAVEDYVKAIYNLHEDAGIVTTQAVAMHLNVAAPSATAMIKKLAGMKLARHTPYRGVELTAAGQKIALEIIRHHRLIETFLAEALGVEWDKVHAEAEKWEHVISEEIEAKMAAVLGNPTHDPHGAPIPTLDGMLPVDDGHPLSTSPPGAQLVVRRVRDEDAQLLRHLGKLGVVPKAEIEVLRAEPSEGVLQIQVAGKTHIIGLSPAASVLVAPREAPARRRPVRPRRTIKTRGTKL